MGLLKNLRNYWEIWRFSWHNSGLLSKPSACFSFQVPGPLFCGNCKSLWLKGLWWGFFCKWAKFEFCYIILDYCVIFNQDKSRNGCYCLNLNSKARDKIIFISTDTLEPLTLNYSFSLRIVTFRNLSIITRSQEMYPYGMLILDCCLYWFHIHYNVINLDWQFFCLMRCPRSFIWALLLLLGAEGVS